MALNFRRILDKEATWFASLILVATFGAIAQWAPNNARAIFSTLALFAFIFWCGLVTHKIRRTAARVRKVERLGLALESDSSKANILSTLKVIEVRSRQSASPPQKPNGSHATPKMESHQTPDTGHALGDLLTSPAHPTVPVRTAQDIATALSRFGPDNISIAGGQSTRLLIKTAMAASEVEAEVDELQLDRPIELPLVNLLVIDAEALASDQREVKFAGKLPPESEIWLIATGSHRDRLLEAVRDQDPGVAFKVDKQRSPIFTEIRAVPK